jgi:hypothetical protein
MYNIGNYRETTENLRETIERNLEKPRETSEKPQRHRPKKIVNDHPLRVLPIRCWFSGVCGVGATYNP